MSFEAIVGCFTQHQQILSLAKEYQFWAVISPICSAPCFLLDGIMIGATRSRTMFIAMFWSVSAYGLLLYVLPTYLGNHGIFLALIVFMLIRACTLYPHTRLSLLSTQLNS